MRALLPAGAIVVLLSSSAGLFAPAERAHGCTDHVCVCRPAARAQAAAPRPATPACHGPERPSGRTFTLQASCNHGQDGATTATSIRPALLPPSPTAVAESAAPLPPAERSRPLTLFRSPETPPPRTSAS